MNGHHLEKDKVEAAKKRKPVRVWMDGSFDMLHIGHIAAMIQARDLGDCLVVGAQSDADVIAHKGPPVHPEEERFRLIQALMCVDKFVGAASYGTSVETLDKHGCDFCVHGDDATLKASDTDFVKQLMKINRAKLVNRGMSISTTHQIRRILQMSDHAENAFDNGDEQSQMHNNNIKMTVENKDTVSYFPTASLITAFAGEKVSLPQEGRVVYVDGAFDLFNVGLLSFLERAAQEGDYLLVGIHSDSTVSCRKGPTFPILGLMERALMVVSLKCVSDVIFGAPTMLTKRFLENFKIDVVCRGKLPTKQIKAGIDPYEIPKKLGIFKVIDSGSDVTSQTIVDRILSKRADYIARNKVKIQKEDAATKRLNALQESS